MPVTISDRTAQELTGWCTRKGIWREDKPLIRQLEIAILKRQRQIREWRNNPASRPARRAKGKKNAG